MAEDTLDCVVTGGSGFIGTHLVRELLADPRIGQIYILDLHPPRVTNPRVTFFSCDLRKPVMFLPERPCRVCFHLAAICKEPGFPWDEYFLANHIGTVNLIDFLRRAGIPSVLYTSTMMVFRPGDRAMGEDSVAAPDTAYGMSKLLGELELRAWSQEAAHRRLRIVRPGVVFGKGENGNFTRMYYALRKGRFAFVGRKTTVKGCVYVKDVVHCLQFLMDDAAPRVSYNLVLPEVTTVEAICEAFFEVFHFRRWVPVVPFPLAYALGLAGEVLSRLGIETGVHHRRIEKLFYSTNLSAGELQTAGFQFQYSLRTALADWRADCAPQDLY